MHISLDDWKIRYPSKFESLETIFNRIHRGDTIFIGSACAEPQHLVQGLIRYVKSNPKAFFDAEVLHVRSLGVAPYATEKFKQNFRHNSFFIGDSTRDAVNKGLADYTPIFLSQVPDLFTRGLARVDIALIQTSLPDSHGYMSLGISVDIVKAAAEKARLVVAQVNANMPRVHGDTFIHIDAVDFLVPYDELLLEYQPEADTDIALIQTSLPDDHGYMSLGISVDIVKAAAEKARLVVAQVNANMPRVHGDTFIHIKDVNYVIPHDEPLLEYQDQVPGEIADRIGKYVARIIEDGDTIQVGKLQLEVWHTPGHTDSQLSFRLGDLLLSGDNIYRDGCVGVIDAHHGSDIPSFISSLKRIRASDVKWLLPSHGPIFRKDNALLDRTIARLEGYLHMADFGTCAVDWPLMEEWDEELAAGQMPTDEAKPKSRTASPSPSGRGPG
jgi:hypothetical protein